MDKCAKTIKIEHDNYTAEIRRNSFPETSSEPYFEDYNVSFITTIQNQKIKATFYLEWDNSIIPPELNLSFLVCRASGKRSKSKMKITKWN